MSLERKSNGSWLLVLLEVPESLTRLDDRRGILPAYKILHHLEPEVDRKAKEETKSITG